LAEFRQFCGGRGIPGDWAGLLKMEEFFQFHEFKPGMLSKKARKCSAQRISAQRLKLLELLWSKGRQLCLSKDDSRNDRGHLNP
jgi:hypothetical protein